MLQNSYPSRKLISLVSNIKFFSNLYYFLKLPFKLFKFIIFSFQLITFNLIMLTCVLVLFFNRSLQEKEFIFFIIAFIIKKLRVF